MSFKSQYHHVRKLRLLLNFVLLHFAPFSCAATSDGLQELLSSNLHYFYVDRIKSNDDIKGTIVDETSSYLELDLLYGF